MWFFLLCFSVFFIVIWYCYQIGSTFPPSRNDKNLESNLFEPLTALFSGLAFAGVVLTIIMQMEEFKRSKEVQKQADEPLKKQLANMELSSKISRLLSYFGNTNDPDKRFIGGEILKGFIQDILNDEIYINIISPEIIMTIKPILIDSPKHGNILIFNLRNSKASAKCRIENKNDFKITVKPLFLGRNVPQKKDSNFPEEYSFKRNMEYEFKIYISNDVEYVNVIFELESELVDIHWLKELQISIKSNPNVSSFFNINLSDGTKFVEWSIS